MKKLIHRVRDWLIRKLGGTPEQETRELKRKIFDLQQDLLIYRTSPLVKWRHYEVVPLMIQNVIPHERIAFMPDQAINKLFDLQREDMAQKIGLKLLRDGFITVSTSNNDKLNAILIEMCVRVLRKEDA